VRSRIDLLARVRWIALLAATIAACGPVAPGATGPASGTLPFDPSAGRADWWVAATDLPLDAQAQLVHGFLEERACASGGSPEGRITGPRIEYRADAVVVTFTVREVGTATCPSNPRFAVTISLAEPVGDRKLLDGGVDPPRDATVDPTIVLVPEVEDCGPLTGTDFGKVACITLENSTVGDRYEAFLTIRVRPAGADCANHACPDEASVEVRSWIVDAVERDGTHHRWTCTYKDEVADCVVATP
jgi:hypothetical protein